jgi:hypothetical protein
MLRIMAGIIVLAVAVALGIGLAVGLLFHFSTAMFIVGAGLLSWIVLGIGWGLLEWLGDWIERRLPVVDPATPPKHWPPAVRLAMARHFR